MPPISYPAELPVSQRKDDIAEVIRDHQVVVIAGETGSGKTTQIPKICLELGRGVDGQIGHTQPRRLAARTVAMRIAEELGSFSAWLADWPGTEIVELWEALAKRFSQMGGNSGPTFLRMVGKDTFILTPSVTAALKHWGAVDAPPKSRKDRAAVQSAFNAWAAETGRPLCQLSLILAASIED